MYSTSRNIRKRDLFSVGKITVNLGSSPNGTYFDANKLGDRGWFVWDATAWVTFPEGHHFSPAEIGSNIEWFANHGVGVEYTAGAGNDQGMLLVDIPGQKF